MDFTKIKHAGIYANDEFFCIVPCMGYLMIRSNRDLPETYLATPPDEAQLGEALVTALNSYRLLKESEIPIYFDLERTMSSYEAWVQDLQNKFQYKTRRALFKYMKYCPVSLYENILVIKPTNHEKLEAWGGKGITKDSYVEMPSSSGFKEIGQAVLLALSRCK